MWNFQRIICIWICCVSCMFGTTQLSTLVAAVPYEYFDDHDQSFYDLDTEQIQAKYDTRLLSQQMLTTQEQQRQEMGVNKKGSSSAGGFAENIKRVDDSVDGASFVLENTKRNDGNADADGSSSRSSSSNILTKLKSNDASKNNSNHNKDSRSGSSSISNKNDWLDETTTAITEKQEIHLPRAASCYTNGQKYTHGQKVPRLDSCEVCLCMDGEIFCWWEKCDKKPAKAQTQRYDDYSTPREESSTMRIQLNEKSTIRTTLRPMKKPKINKDYKYVRNEFDNDNDDDGGDEDDAENVNMDDGDEAAVADEDLDEYIDIKQRHSIRPYKSHNKQMAKKKSRGQHQEALDQKLKQIKAKKEKQKKQQLQQQQQQTQQQQQQQQQHKGNGGDHHYHHAENHASSGSSKILNFPENLPSVLYYDYKTEEHQHHQHQHREQHLKHQHEKELKHRQHAVAGRHHEYGEEIGQDFNTDAAAAAAVGGLGIGIVMGDDNYDDAVVVMHRQHQQPPSSSSLSSSSAKYLANGNDNIYNVDLQTDSDILPEPPTKKPKLPSIATASVASAAGTPTTTLSYRLSSLTAAGQAAAAAATSAGASTTTVTSRPLKKQMFSPWDYGKPNRDKVNNAINQRQQQQQHIANNNPNEEVAANDDQDDAFHRWLTSTEKNKNNNNAGLDDVDFVGGLNDFAGVADKNYENIDIDTNAMSLQATTKAPQAAHPTATAAVAGESMQYQGNSGNPKYEINYSDTNSGNTDNSNSNMNNNNNNMDNISPFSNPYQSYTNSNNNINNNNPIAITEDDGKSQSGSRSSGTTSNSSSNDEDNGVGNVVNIDIMLTASADIAQQTDTKDQQHQLSSEHDKQIPDTANAKPDPLLISNSNANDNEAIATMNNNNSSSSSSSSVGIQQTLGGNLLSLSSTSNSNNNNGINNSSANNNNNNINNNNSSSYSNSDSFKLNHFLVSNSTAASWLLESASATSSSQTTPPTSTTLSPERQCNVMGTLYKIGDVLPQDTGNCLQCICIDGSTMDDTPRVTCSPHNCPPLVLPDLFDATGY